MARKKGRQVDPNESSESGDASAVATGPASGCTHVARAVDLSSVKKKLKGGVSTLCDICAKKSKVANVESDVTLHNAENAEGEIDESFWMCLKCAHIGCGRGQYKHAYAHFSTPRSDQHDLVVDIDAWVVWCYSCEKKMALDSTKKLKECGEYIRRHLQTSSKPSGTSVDVLPSVNQISDKPQMSEMKITEETETAKRTSKTLKTKTVENSSRNLVKLMKVRGLINLGNTCFYNSVLQCLSVTPYLTKVLEKLTSSGEEFVLSGHVKLDDLEVPAVEGRLGDSGALSNALLTTLVDMRSPDLHADTLRPQELLKKVQQNFPQFRGYEQHDAHELLRHLLEGVRSDDLKRFQEVILKQNGLYKNKNNDISDQMKKRIKLYGQQLQDLTLGVEGIFKGQLVSIIECQDCRHTSTRFESFLDLSLPVMEDKPLPPMRKKEQTESFGTDSTPSKYQLKKQRKAAKRNKSHKARRDEKTDDFLTTLEENSRASDGDEAEQSDADVEDNVEQDSTVSANSKEIGESGYSSDKHNTGESDGSSPSIAVTNCDGNLDEVSNAALTLSCPTLPASSTSTTSPSELDSSLMLESTLTPALLQPNVNPLSPADDWTENHVLEHQCVSSVCECMENCNANISVRCFTPVDEELRITIPENGEGSIHISPINPLERPHSRCSFLSNELQSNGPSSSLSQGLESKFLSLCIDDESSALTSCGKMPVVSGICGGGLIETLETCEDSEPTETMDNIPESINDLSLQSNGLENNENGNENRYESQEQKVQKCVSKEEQFKPLNNERNEQELDSVSVAEKDNDYQESSRDQQASETCVGVASKSTKLVNENPMNVEEAIDSKKDVSDWCKTLAPRTQSEEGDCSVASCLNQFTSLELMTGSNKVGCDACSQRQNKGSDGKTVYTNSTKQLLISSPPPVLILHLKRFMMENFRFKKLQRFVSFPLDLDIASFCSTKCKDSTLSSEAQSMVRYSLYGIVEHTGSLNSGHYVAYVKIRPLLGADDPRWSFLPKTREFVYPKMNTHAQSHLINSTDLEGKWYSISDSRVVEIAESKVLKSQAYLLFYERVL